MIPLDVSPNSISLKLFVCTKTHCTERVVCVKIRTADATTQELNGPSLLRALEKLMTEKGIAGRVLEVSCMGGCTIGPRLNVVGTDGFKGTVRYLHVVSGKRKPLCVPWEKIESLEALLEHHVQKEERKAR
ncbi:MAG: (2Fe-2S) ferredoxin domain-containing protein [Candidatus Binatia bacterium]